MFVTNQHAMQIARETKLPVHGFVLAGGKSSRMGRDKATLLFCGQPMVEVALEKLRGFCAETSIAGNRQDLSAFAAIISETRVEVGPAAGIEAGLNACQQPWAMFMPVDVPVVPAWLLQAWAEDIIENAATSASGGYLVVEGNQESAFCILRRDILSNWTEMLNQGERSLKSLLARAAAPSRSPVHGVTVAKYAPRARSRQIQSWFSNVNTPEELAKAARDSRGESRVD